MGEPWVPPRRGEVEVQGVQEFDGGVRGVHLHVGGGVDQRRRVVEDDLHARADEPVGRLLRGLGRDRQDADHDAAVVDDLVEGLEGAHGDAPERGPDLRRVDVEDRRDRDAVLREDRRRGDRPAEAARADQRDVVLPLGAQDLADLGEERVDRVADAALAELPEGREVAADLRRVDVRVLGDLLRRDPVLAHLPRLREHLEVPAQASGDSDRQAFRHQRPSGEFENDAAHCADALPGPAGGTVSRATRPWPVRRGRRAGRPRRPRT